MRNPPLFPAYHFEGTNHPDGSGTLEGREIDGGADLRDLFAGLAIAGLMVQTDIAETVERGGLRKVADVAFMVADAMLDARKGGVQ